jgi:hypothetical protein
MLKPDIVTELSVKNSMSTPSYCRTFDRLPEYDVQNGVPVLYETS